METRPYQQCALSLMDTVSDPDISFDEKGICNYYYDYRKAVDTIVKKGAAGKKALDELAEQIKKDGKGKPYDCIIGLSGGVDSTYVAWLTKQLGLRPLAIHFDNGWNSELSVMNIENIVNKLNIDLHTFVVDWEEFRDVQLSYIKASVVDIEVPTDHAIEAATWEIALRHNIKYILSGNNVYTEHIMPRSWIFNKRDHINLKAIHQQYGTRKLKKFPLNDTLLKKKSAWAHIEILKPLNYADFDKKKAKELITKELGWRDYGGKHYESLFTKFYQAYILPQKFGIDKRKPHLSNLVFSGQMTREQALEEIGQPLYNPQQFQMEKDFFLKKLELTEDAWEKIMKMPRRSHYDFDIERPLDDRYKVLKPAKYIYRKIMGNS